VSSSIRHRLVDVSPVVHRKNNQKLTPDELVVWRKVRMIPVDVLLNAGKMDHGIGSSLKSGCKRETWTTWTHLSDSELERECNLLIETGRNGEEEDMPYQQGN